jgi:ketosteroid isomerase-like protein
MTSTDTFSRVQALLESYRLAFERSDAAAIAEHFAYPGHIASDGAEVTLISIASRQDCIEAVDKVIAMHRQLGTPSGTIHDLSVIELSPRLALACLRMEVRGLAAKRLYDFNATYTVAKINGSWLIVAISHNQLPRLRACLAQR